MSEVENVRNLMEADRWIDRVLSQRSHLPESFELESLEEDLRGLMKSLRAAQDALVPVRTAYEDAKNEAERLQVRASDLEKRLISSTAHARELTAVQSELTHVRELLSTANDREFELLVELEPLEEAVVTIKSQAQPGMVRRGELQAMVGELQASLDEELVSLRRDRELKSLALAGDFKSRYDYAMNQVGTSGAAQVDAGRCDGCRIALSPLDFDRWKAQPEGSLMVCPHCSRLLLP